MTTVDRRAVQELFERVCEMDAIPHSSGRDERRYLHDQFLARLAELPSTNAQAVAWQWRAIGSDGRWFEGTKEEFDRGVAGYEYRALCVCSGDARPVAVLRVRTGRGAASGLKQWDCQHLLTTYVAELPDGEYSLGIIPTGDAKEA